MGRNMNINFRGNVVFGQPYFRYDSDPISFYIAAEKSAGNWDLIDEVWFFTDLLPTPLVGIKAGTLATINGTVNIGNNGARVATPGNNSDHIDTGLTLTSLSNYSTTSAFHGAFVYANDDTNNVRYLYGVADNAAGEEAYCYQNTSSSQIQFRVNDDDANNLISSDLYFDNQTLYSFSRKTDGKVYGYKNGTEAINRVSAVGAIPSDNSLTVCGAYIGFFSTVRGSIDADILSFVIGGGDGFDHDAHNTNIRQLFSDLGIILS